VFTSLATGEPFSPRNPGRIRRVGLVVVGWRALAPFLKYFGALAVLGRLEVRGLVLKPPIDFNPDALILGLAIVVLAEVFQRATVLQREQSLTV
jgi:hypothetical protein